MASSDVSAATIAGHLPRGVSLDPFPTAGKMSTGGDGKLVPVQTDPTSGEEWLKVMAECFARLDEGHRQVLTLRTRFNLSYEEIAVELQTHAGAVRETVRRAREHLRMLLIEHCPGFPPQDPTLSPAAG